MSEHKPKGAWHSIKGVIGAVAPGLATALGGPLAGQAVSVITAALGLAPDQEDQAIKALATSPEALLKLKLAEVEFRKFLKESDIRLEETASADRKDARALAIAKGLFPQVSLSVVYTLGYFGMVFGLMTGDLAIPADGAQLFSGLVGIMTAAQVQIMNFWFGSSRSSQEKDHGRT